MSALPKEFLREHQIISVLEAICQELELSATQHQMAEERYGAVGKWLSEGDSPILRHLTIYPHGSVALGTTVKPRGRNEHDVDLVSRVLGLLRSFPPSQLKAIIGARLREHAYYASILEEKRRCWRLNYANEFHLDITPSILNPDCPNGGELVPDKELRCWKPTNPRGYKQQFDRRALLVPRIRFGKALLEHRADIEPFPAQTMSKGVLRRSVQLGKRHRDIFFERLQALEQAPISVILTTLTAQAYELCVTTQVYDTELQLLVDVVRTMPAFIEGPPRGHRRWAIWNETTAGENFAEKWNQDEALPAAFFAWHQDFLATVEHVAHVNGLDQLSEYLGEAFGPRPVNAAMNALTASISTARSAGGLFVVPSLGLSTAASGGTVVRGNTFYGAE